MADASLFDHCREVSESMADAGVFDRCSFVSEPGASLEDLSVESIAGAGVFDRRKKKVNPALAEHISPLNRWLMLAFLTIAGK
jgi:hypothetical protein